MRTKDAGRKLLHQSSDSNTKPDYIMGHSCQALALLARVGRFHHATPLCARIHEGLVFSNRDQRTLLDKRLLLLAMLQLSEPVLLVADAYYASRKIIHGLLGKNCHLVSRLRWPESAPVGALIWRDLAKVEVRDLPGPQNYPSMIDASERGELILLVLSCARAIGRAVRAEHSRGSLTLMEANPRWYRYLSAA